MHHLAIDFLDFVLLSNFCVVPLTIGCLFSSLLILLDPIDAASSNISPLLCSTTLFIKSIRFEDR